MLPESPVLLSQFYVPEKVIAKDQPEYIPLPAVVSKDGQMVTTRWGLSWKERIALLFGGSLYVQVLTFGDRLQPMKLLSKEPTIEDCGR